MNSKIRFENLDFRNYISEFRIKKSAFKNQHSEIRIHKSEVRIQKSEFRNPIIVKHGEHNVTIRYQ